MDTETPFRIVLIAGSLVLAPAGLWHRIRARQPGEKLDRSQEGWFILLTLRPIALIGASCFIAYLAQPSLMDWSAMPLPPALRWVGAPIGGAGIVLFLGVFRALGRNLTDTVVVRKSHTLVTDGPYRYVRHPLYTALILTTVGTTLLSANWFLGLVGTVCFALIHRRTTTEEANLIDRFGDEYRAYMERTGRYFPKRRPGPRHPSA